MLTEKTEFKTFKGIELSRKKNHQWQHLASPKRCLDAIRVRKDMTGFRPLSHSACTDENKNLDMILWMGFFS